MKIPPEISTSILSSRLFSEVNVDPTGDLILDYLIDWDNEEPYLDFKTIISISTTDFPEIAKDVFAFSNFGGGYFLIGFKQRAEKITPSMTDIERRRFIPIGLPADFAIEPANLQTKFNAYTSEQLALEYREFTREFEEELRRFAVIYVPPSTTVLNRSKMGTI